MPAHLRLNNLCFWGQHGHNLCEQELGNRFEVDVDLSVDVASAAELDRIDLTVDLTQVYDVVRQHVQGKSFRLIETLAQQIVQDLVQFPGVLQATVRLRKVFPPFPGATQGAMEVEITRTP